MGEGKSLKISMQFLFPRVINGNVIQVAYLCTHYYFPQLDVFQFLVKLIL